MAKGLMITAKFAARVKSFPHLRKLSAVGRELMVARVRKLRTPFGRSKMIDRQVRSPSSATSFRKSP